MPEQRVPCSPWRHHGGAGISLQPSAGWASGSRPRSTHHSFIGKDKVRPVGTTWRSNHQPRTHLAERGWWHATPEAAGQQTPSKPATSDARCGLWSCAREPTNRPHGPQAPGDTPTPNPGDPEVTAATLSCRPGPLLLLLAQLYFQKAFADSGSTKVSTVHAEVDTNALSSTSFCEGISQTCPDHRNLSRTSVLNFAVLGEGSPRTAQRK